MRITALRIKAAALVAEALVLSCLLGCRTQLVRDIEKWEGVVSELETVHAQELEAAKTLTQNGEMTAEERAVCWPTAQWLDCLDRTYGQLPASAKGLAVWVVYNRMESVMYPDTAIEVLQQPGQFAEYDSDITPTQESLDIARGEYAHWIAGAARPCGEDAVFISVGADGIAVRDNFDVSKASIWRSAQ